MLKAFYIYYLEGTEVFQLRTTKEHFCYASSGSLDDIKVSLAKIVKRVRTLEGLYKEVASIHSGHYPSTQELREVEYHTNLHKAFEVEVEEIIRATLKEIPNPNNILKRSLKKLDSIKKVEDIKDTYIKGNTKPTIHTNKGTKFTFRPKS